MSTALDCIVADAGNILALIEAIQRAAASGRACAPELLSIQ